MYVVPVLVAALAFWIAVFAWYDWDAASKAYDGTLPHHVTDVVGAHHSTVNEPTTPSASNRVDPHSGMPTGSTTPSNAHAYAGAINRLSHNLYKQLEGDDNLVMSGLSVHTVLSMTYLGAGIGSVTQRELMSVLQYDRLVNSDAITALTSQDVLQRYQQWSTVQNELLHNAQVTVKLANQLIISDRLPVSPAYLQTLHHHYGVDPIVADFTQTDQIKAVVNTWAREQTNGKIDPLLDALDPEAVLILLNAIYFKGEWLEPFTLQDTTSPFYMQSGAVTQMRFMFCIGMYRYFEDDVKQVIDIPYRVTETDDAGDATSDASPLSMYIVLPKQASDAPTTLAEYINFDQLNNLIDHRMNSVKVALRMPKFRVESKIQLIAPCKSLGLTSIFSDRADLSLMAEHLYVSQFFQKAFIEINEVGTEAAAVTVAMISQTSVSPPPVQFKANRPFFYMIRDNVSKTVLFQGHIKTLS